MNFGANSLTRGVVRPPVTERHVWLVHDQRLREGES